MLPTGLLGLGKYASYFCCLTKYSAHSPSWQKGMEAQVLRWLVTLCPESENRKRRMLVRSLLSLFSIFIQSVTLTRKTALSTFKMKFSFSRNLSRNSLTDTT